MKTDPSINGEWSRSWTDWRVGDLVWHVTPGRVDEFRALMRDEAKGAQGRDQATSGESAGAWRANASVLKEDKGTSVVAVGDWVVKESGPRRGRSAWRFGLRLSGSRRAFILAGMLLRRGISTPEPLAWATRRRFGLRIRDSLITRRINEVEGLRSRCRRLSDDPRERANTLMSLGQLVASFHARGFSNRDLKDDNILCPVAGPLRMWVVDLDGVRRRPWVSRARARRDLWPIVRSLGRLGWLAESDADAFLRGYNEGVRVRLRLSRLPYLDRRIALDPAAGPAV